MDQILYLAQLPLRAVEQEVLVQLLRLVQLLVVVGVLVAEGLLVLHLERQGAQEHLVKATLAAREEMHLALMTICNLAVAVEQAKQVKQVKPLREVRAAMARHLLFLGRL
jgi:hypothetical protein